MSLSLSVEISSFLAGCTVWKDGEPVKIRLSALEIGIHYFDCFVRYYVERLEREKRELPCLGSSIFERSHNVPETVVYAGKPVYSYALRCQQFGPIPGSR